VLAIGAMGNDGYVYTYQYNGSAWTLLGYRLSTGNAAQFGVAIDLSSDGTILAVGSNLYNFQAGSVQVLHAGTVRCTAPPTLSTRCVVPLPFVKRKSSFLLHDSVVCRPYSQLHRVPTHREQGLPLSKCMRTILRRNTTTILHMTQPEMLE
jgi:hypothetical protein